MRNVVSIQLSGLARKHAGERMLGIFEALMPVRFVSGEQAGCEIAASIRIDEPNHREDIRIGKYPACLSVAGHADSLAASRTVEFDVKFSDDARVPFPFRGRTVRAPFGEAWPPLTMGSGERPLATTANGAIWSVSEGCVEHFRSALPLPRISESEGFVNVFNGNCFLQTLIVLQFLKSLSAQGAYQPAPLRAAFIVDDPNLHWLRYGFVDYREVADHAERENYHVSFAMIPMDTWFTHLPTAAILRANAHRISLLVHGNNHSREELAKKYSDGVRAALLQQAIGRIERFERKADLRVCRTMVPPHGACSSDMLAALPMAGFEAACISTSSLCAYNRDEAWTSTAGFAPSEVIAGCCVLPRWGLTGRVENTLLIAAYLGQPLILRGHHQDLKDGLGAFDRLAGLINGLGTVRWSNLTGLCRLNYQWRMEGTTCCVKPFGDTLQVDVPAGATSLFIDDLANSADRTWAIRTQTGATHTIASGHAFEMTGRAGNAVVVNRKRMPRNPFAYTAPRTGAKLILRRLLTEARDRLLIG